MELRELLKRDFGVDLPISGGPGNSKDNPVVILPEAGNGYVAVEYTVLRCLGAGRGIDWKVIGQVLMSYNGRDLDQIKIETVETTETQIITQTENYYFDVTDLIRARSNPGTEINQSTFVN